MSAVPVLGTTIPAPQKPTDRSKTNLIVNYLPQTMAEADVKAMFSPFGIVESCKLIRDKTTQVSLGYAFVNYDTAESAAKGIQALNGHIVNGKSIKVSYARPSSVEIKNANLYVAQLPKQFTQVDLEKVFAPYGTIITSKILTDSSGESRGAGFVRFDKHSEAEHARKSLDGSMLPDEATPLIVKYANKKSPAVTIDPGSVGVVPNLAQPTNTVGPMRIQTTGSWRYNPMAAAAATVGAYAAPPRVMTQPYCIYVYNMPEDGNDNTLYQLFSPFGAIANVKAIVDYETSQCKGYGFVNMMSYDDAMRAIMALNGTLYQGKKLQVSFKTSKKQ